MKLLLAKIISKIFGNFIIKICKGIWQTKHKVNQTSNAFMKQLLLLSYDNALLKYGSYIGYTAKFSDIPLFPHGIIGVFISAGAEIGKNCVIFQQVTIGSNTLIDSDRKGAPVICDNCYIGAGAKIIGNVKVGNNCRIGANCVIVNDIPDNSVVVLNAPRIIQKGNMNNRYYSLS
jgi:serine O-acetyltransferase